MFETLKHVLKTEKHCCVFKDNSCLKIPKIFHFWMKFLAVFRFLLGTYVSLFCQCCIYIIYMWVIDQVWGQDGWILAKFFFLRVYGPSQSRGPKTCRKRTRLISSHLDWTSLVTEGFISIWLLEKFFACRPQWVVLSRPGPSCSKAG